MSARFLFYWLLKQSLRLLLASCHWLRRGGCPEVVRRVLVVKLDQIGDVVLATPFLRELRRSFPGAEITLVVTATSEPLVRHCPYVDRLVRFSPVRGDAAARERSAICAMITGMRMRAKRFDVAVVPRWDIDCCDAYYLLCGAGARHLVVHSRTLTAVKDTLLRRIEVAEATILHREELAHEVTRSLQVLLAMGGTVRDDQLELWPSAEEKERASAWLRGFAAAEGTLLVGFGIGASHPAKCWPESSYARLANGLISRWNARVVLLGGGPDDVERAAKILAATDPMCVRSAVDVLGLAEAAALLQHCGLFVGNDSGPMHIAAAMGVRVVEVSGSPEGSDPTGHRSPLRFGPWGVPSRVVRPQAGAGQSASASGLEVLAISEVRVEAVEEAAEELLSLPRTAAASGSGWHAVSPSAQQGARTSPVIGPTTPR